MVSEHGDRFHYQNSEPRGAAVHGSSRCLAAEQARRNRARDGHWEASAGHRALVTECILSLAPKPPGRLCLLGAGNANDLDLPRLLAAFGEVHLVDLDSEALQRGVARQVPASERGKLRLHGAVDVTGVGEALDAVGDRSSAELERLVDRALEAEPVSLSVSERAGVRDVERTSIRYLPPGPFEVVASVGILSQLIDIVVRAVPRTNRCFMPLLLSVRTGHLRLMARLTAPGGHGLLITDFVSSETVPELATVDSAELPALAARLANQRNFFHGLNPLVLPTLLDGDPILRELVASRAHRGYWLWNQQSRVYAVLAIEFTRVNR